MLLLHQQVQPDLYRPAARPGVASALGILSHTVDTHFGRRVNGVYTPLDLYWLASTIASVNKPVKKHS